MYDSSARGILAVPLVTLALLLSAPGSTLDAQEPEAPERGGSRECICFPSLEGEELRELMERARELGAEARRQAFEFQGPRIEVFRGPPRGARGPAPLRLGFAGGRLGVSVTDLNPELGAYFGAERGVLVLDVEEDAPLALRPGDVVVSVAGRPVEDGGHFRDIVRSYRSGEEISLEVLREGQNVEVRGTLD